MKPTYNTQEILRVNRTKEEAQKSYDKLSKYYDLISGSFENHYKCRALNRIKVNQGEQILEVGFGTGYCLEKIAISVGETGKAIGMDLSTGMIEIARNRINKSLLTKRVHMDCGDATNLPYKNGVFDAIFCSFSLELFDTPEIPIVLSEMMRVLKSGGRLGIISMSKENHISFMTKVYEWCHLHFEIFTDCRPIRAEESIQQAGFFVTFVEKVDMFGLPARIVAAKK